MGLFEERKIISREKRLSAITAFEGYNKSLQEELGVPEVRQRIRTFSQGNRDEILHSLELLSSIRDIPVVIHGAAGCSAASLYFNKDNQHAVWYTTDLNERDTIMGSDEKLRTTIERIYREQKPRAVFVISTPIVAINNDDINSVILELEEELDLQIISIETDGFKSKAGINGYDIALHAIGRKLITEKAYTESEDFINLISVSENIQGINEVTRLLEKLELRVNVIPRLAGLEDIRKAGKAKATIAINDDEADILLQGLEERTKVLSIRSRVPIGCYGTFAWLEELGKQLQIQNKVIHLSKQEEKRLEKYISKQPLRGKKVFLDLQTSVTAQLAGLIEELGGKVIGISTTHIDSNNLAYLQQLPHDLYIKIGEGQSFELENILTKLKPDYYVGTAAHAGLVSKHNILPIATDNLILYGYEGVLELIQSFQKADRRKSFVNYLAENTESPYSPGWLNKNANWYIKQEVK